MRIRYDYVLVKPIIIEAGIKIDTDYDPNKHKPNLGLVVSVPSELRYKGREAAKLRGTKLRGNLTAKRLAEVNAETVDLDVEMEVEVGDIVYFPFTALSEAERKGIVIEGGYLLRYDDLILSKRGDEIIPLNGNALVIPSEKEEEDFEVFRDTYRTMKGTIAHLGSLVKHYFYYPEHIDEDDVSVGDEVYFRRTYGVPVETEIYRTLDRMYYYMPRRVILCKV